MARREFDREKLIALYQELELRALLKDLASQYPEPETADMEQETPISYQAQSVIHLAEPEDLQQLVPETISPDYYLDCESDPRQYYDSAGNKYGTVSRRAAVLYSV